jgi:hypothetical protein
LVELLLQVQDLVSAERALLLVFYELLQLRNVLGVLLREIFDHLLVLLLLGLEVLNVV